jgi:uncharacterized membrane protein (DUF4010 family)
VKITALVASLEFVSFIIFHLVSGKKSLLLQGFFGGFISSTTVFVQLNFDKRFEHIDEKSIAASLLMAICSMLIECHLILISILNSFSIRALMPFSIMLIFTLVFTFLSLHLKKPSTAEIQDLNDIEIDDPINWKKVFTFSTFIILLKLGMILVQTFTSIPILAAIFLTSIFEAHAVLAVNATSFSIETQLPEMYQMILVILVGSLISKIFLVLKGQNIKNKKLVLLPIIASTVLTLIASYLLLLIY